MHVNRLVPSAVLCVVLAVGATGCEGSGGSSGKAAALASTSAAASASASPSGPDFTTMSAAQVVDRSRAAMASVGSMHVTGTMISAGDKLTIDLSADKDKNCTGTVSSSAVGSMQLIHTGASTWMKPDAAFLQHIAAQQGGGSADAAVLQLFQGRWLTGGQDDPDLQSMAGMCDLMSNIPGGDSKLTSATKGNATNLNGAPVLTVLVSDDSGPSTLYVSAEGQPYLLRVDDDAPGGGTVNFGDFNKPLTVQAPPADQVVDFSVFQQKLRSA
jgi:hypothetical protein